MNKKNIAIVGLGKIGLLHLSILRNLANVKIVGLVDEKASVQKTVRGMGIGIPFFPTIEKLTANEKVDGVFACIPPAFNPLIAKALIPSGISLFVEKPMAASLDEAQAMSSLLAKQESPPANAVGYMVAFYATFSKAREILGSSALGKIESYTASMFLGEVFKKQEGWRQNPKISGGGAVAVLGSHLLYLIQNLLGIPREVSATTTNLYSDVEDKARITFQHESFKGEASISWSVEGYSDMAIGLEIKGTEGILRVQENVLALGMKNTKEWKVWYPWDIPGSHPTAGKMVVSREGYAAQDIAFVESLGGMKENPVSWKEGINVQAMIEGIYSSSSSPGKNIPLKV